jgi:hypothetical protein
MALSDDERPPLSNSDRGSKEEEVSLVDDKGGGGRCSCGVGQRGDGRDVEGSAPCISKEKRLMLFVLDSPL